MTKCFATVIRADGSSEDLGHKPDYDEAKGIIGGYLEVAHGRDSHGVFQLIVDEDGLMKNLPLNATACGLYRVSPIVGKAILLRGWRWT